MSLLQPKEIEILDGSGVLRKFIISKFPAIAGREIIMKYPLSSIPKVGDYAINEETMLKLMAYVAVQPTPDMEPIKLTTRSLIDNHVPDWECLSKIEIAMIEYNCSFFQNGMAAIFLESLKLKFQDVVLNTLTGFFQQSLQKEKQR